MRVLDETDARTLHSYIIDLYKSFIPVKAIPPDMGGEGELERAKVLEDELRRLGLRVWRVDARDERARGGIRPNILAQLEGADTSRTLWIVAHMDTVPEGDRSLWRYEPYSVTVEDDYVYGRGVEDNGQAIVVAFAVAKYLVERGVKPRVNLGIALVSDEETGSRYGLQYLLSQNVFGTPESNWFLVPDAGSPDGSKVIVAEKHILWFKIRVVGMQAHASTPHEGINAHRLGMMFNLELDRILHTRFTRYDPIFEPPVSTFEPTRKEENVSNINTIPGVDTVYWDARILPSYSIDEVVETVKSTAYSFASSHGIKVEVEIVARDDAGEPTSPDHPFTRAFLRAIREARNVEPKLLGIGGGTIARYLRKKGYPALVWMTCEETAHKPNERARLSSILADVDTVLYYLLHVA
ncbi:M20 family metallo-hydrolase [Hyperthermus butylicus]|uniref:Acetylornithine deacetylase related protein n=1 Tax=Hyperthermus butylicus (strain DSM 5456 / JCM 9403 / PLM1-5) TaxID=415426 RepID=A2BJ40_HYPBU|nr:M20 family metallo-hydrolase [Hyperthermus butylicus]ABM80001.1 Acetylornithine deacetylase related protein [Hyperthermus butylicus DSM 5456]